MFQNPFFKALLQEVLADSEQNLERAILPEHMFGDDGDESESAESLVDDEGAVDEVEDFMVPAQAALGIGLQKDLSFADEVAEAEPHSLMTPLTMTPLKMMNRRLRRSLAQKLSHGANASCSTMKAQPSDQRMLARKWIRLISLVRLASG